MLKDSTVVTNLPVKDIVTRRVNFMKTARL